MKFLKLSVLVLLLLACKTEKKEPKPKKQTEKELIAKAKDIHKRVMTLDTHVDISVSNFTKEKNYNDELGNQVNLPTMEKGGLDVAWFIVYTGQGELNEEGYKKAYANAKAKFDAIHRLCKEIAPTRIGLATSSEEARKIYASGKKVAMIGIENGYPIGTDVSRVKEFYDLGARYMSLSHNGHSQLCDSNTGEEDNKWLHNGVSDLGKEVIKEMNKWGMMIDVSHPSKKSMQDMIELSKAPIIASHSSARALCNHSRNLDDEQLEWIKKNGGVVQTVAFSSYTNTEKHNAYNKALTEKIKEFAKADNFEIKSWSDVWKFELKDREKYLDAYRAYRKNARTAMKSSDVKPVNVADFVDHIDYMVKKIGLDHVGISSDFDGGGGIDGWNDASETLNVTIELVRRGYTEKQIEQLWNGNLLRVLDKVQQVAKEIQASESA